MKQFIHWIRTMILAAVLLAGPSLLAQGFQIGTIAGVALDETGGVLPGVNVEVVSTERGLTRTATTGSEGRYRIPSLPLGRYDVRASLQGFQPVAVRNVLVEQDKTTDVPLTLGLSAETVEITITGEAPVVDPTNVSVNTRVSTEEFEQAPVGRSYQSLLAFAPGVIDHPGNPSGGNPQVHGATSDSNVFLFDGVDTTDTTTGTFGSNFNFEAIQEVAIYTSGVSAEYGRATGAIMNVITKSGTNELEGSIKAIATNDAWNEQNKTTNPVTGSSFARVKNDVDNILYSGTLGGPVWRDRAWFFGAYETIENSGTPQTTTVTNEEFIANTELTLENYRLTAQITPNINVWGKYASDPFVGIIRDYWGSAPELFSLTGQDQGGDNWAVQSTALLGGNWLAEAMYAESGILITVVPYSRSPLHNGAPHYSYEDGKYYNGSRFEGFVDRPRTQMLGGLTYYTDLFGQSHNFKAGIDWQELESGALFIFPNNQLYLDDTFDPVTRSFEPSERLDFESGPSTSTGEIMAVYLRDKFEIGSRLYLEAGLRFEQQTGENDLGDPILDTTVIAPRLSGSYDLTGDSRTLLNATAGRFYQSVVQSFADNFAAVPQQAAYDYYVWNGTEYEFVRNFPAGASGLEPNLGLDPQYVDEITFGVQRQLGSTMAVGARGIVREFGDMIDDVITFTPDGAIRTDYVNLSAAERDYRGLELTFEKRFSNRWSGLVNYTYSETRGNNLASGAGGSYSIIGDFPDAQCEVADDPSVGTFDEFYGTQILPCAELTGSRAQGRPTWDIPHLVNLLGVYSRPLGPVNLSVGTSANWQSGNSFSKARTARVLDPLTGESSGQTLTYYYEGVGSDRLPSWWELNLSTEVTWRAFQTMEIGAKAEVFNVTNEQDQFVVSNTTWCEADTASCQTARDRFGLGTSRGSYNAPRGYRVTALVRF